MLSPSITRRLIELVADAEADGRRRRARAAMARLTDREREVALAIARGCANAEIAAELYMSVATVKAHVTRLLAKLELDNPVGAARAAGPRRGRGLRRGARAGGTRPLRRRAGVAPRCAE